MVLMPAHGQLARQVVSGRASLNKRHQIIAAFLQEHLKVLINSDSQKLNYVKHSNTPAKY
jgi:hypothetical protein